MSLCSFVRTKQFSVTAFLTLVVLTFSVATLSAASTTVTLTSSATPTAAEPGVTVASVTGNGFPAGTIVPANVQIQLQPVSRGAGPILSGVATSVTTVIGSTRRVSFQVTAPSASSAISSPVAYVVSLSGSTTTGTSFASGNTSALTVNPQAAIQSISPSTSAPGQATQVKITGFFTNLFQGSSVASFGAGIAVGGAPAGAAGPITVVNATTALAQISVAPGASPGLNTVTVYTGSEVALLTNGFKISGSASLTQVNPNAGQQGQSGISVALTGLYTHWMQGTTNVTFGAGITVASLTVNSATSATAVVNISAAAPIGANTVTVTTGAESVTLTNGFTVNAATPLLTGINPSAGLQGQNGISVALTGLYTHWVQGNTNVSFGAGITVTSVTVNSAVSATAVINVASTEPIGARSVSVTTGSESETLANGFTVTAGTPSLTVINPNTGPQGQNGLSVALTGVYTHWVQGTTSVTFGAGITVASLTVSSATSATAIVNIAPTAAPGTSNVTVTTGGEVVTLAKGFTVTAGTPALTVINPNTGQEGQNGLLVALTGVYTHWVQGTTSVTFGAGITVASLTVSSATSATAVLNIASNAAPSASGVTVTTGGEVVTLANGFTITAGTPGLTMINPNTGETGQTGLSVTLTGQFTHWAQGNTIATFEAGITVSSLTVTSPTSATAILSIASTSAVGYSNVSVATGAEVVTLADGFIVINNTPALTRVSPNKGQQQNVISLPAGTLTFDNPPPGLVPNNFIQGSPVGANSRLTDQFRNFGAVFATFVGEPYAALIDLTGQAPSGTNGIGPVNKAGNLDYTQDLDVFLVVPGTTTPAVTDYVSIQGDLIPIPGNVIFSAYDLGGNLLTSGVQPDTAGGLYALSAPGIHEFRIHSETGTVAYDNLSFDVPAAPSTVTVLLTGQYTHFAQGVSTASFGAGVNVISLTVHSQTSATAVVSVSGAAAVGSQDVTVTTGSEVVTLKNGFTVTEGNPLLTRVTPNMGQQGQNNLSVSLTGQFTHFVQGTTTASFGSGITVSSLTVNSATSAVAVVNVDPTAVDARNVTVTTGSEFVSLPNVFIVANGEASLTKANPNSGQQGQQNVTVNLTGQFTHFAQGTTSATFGSGVTVAALTVNSATSATAVLNISAVAAPGARTITVTTAEEVVALTNGFTVAGGTPALTQINPNTAQPGQPNVSVALTGVYTSFTPGTTTASFGDGINVISVTVTSATTATAVLSVSSAASLGARDVTVTTGGEVVTLAGGFTVVAGAPALSGINPASGPQGASNLSVTINGQFTHFSSASAITFTGAGISAGAPTSVTATSITVPITIAPTAAVGPRGVQVATGSEVVSLAPAFTITAGGNTPVITSVTPSSALPGQSVAVTITGQNTNFVQGVTTANFGPGVMVGNGIVGAFGPVTVTGPTTAVAQISIPARAQLGSRTVVVRTNREQPSLVSGFLVAGPPTLVSVVPSSGQPGQTFMVTINGAYTHFQNGVTQANLGAGISVGGSAPGAAGPVVVTSASSATAQITISANAAVGLRDATVTTGNEQASSIAAFLVQGAVTGPAPTVTISSPTEGTEVTSLTTVTGTVNSPNLASWSLEYEGSGSTVFTQFAHGNSSGVTGSFDPTMLLNGQATIRLTATDQSGQSSTTSVDVILTGNAKIGNFTLSFVDVSVPVADLPVEVVRTYDSRVKSSGDFGYGWNVSYNTVAVQINGILGSSWHESQSGGLIPSYCLVAPSNIIVSIRLQNGVVYQFSPVASSDTRCNELFPPASAGIAFVPVGNTPQNAALSAPSAIGLFVSGAFPNPVQLLDSDTLLPVDPDQFILTMPNGQQLQISRSFGLQTITDRNQNTLTFTANGITSSAGPAISFVRDSLNRITSITDPNGKVHSYIYSDSGDLAGSTDPLQNTSTYSYDSVHNLLSFNDPSGNQPTRAVYDDSGRLIQIIDGLGHMTNLSHDLAARTETVNDQLGNQTTYIYDSRGNVLSSTDPLGDVTSSTYDSHDNVLSHTDPLGHTTSFTYDANNNRLTQTDALGNTVAWTYDTYGNVLSITDANGNKQTKAYDINGNMLSITDPLNNQTSWTYDANGNQTSMTDALGRTVNYTRDASGNLTSIQDPAGNISTFTIDANGNRTSQTDPLGRTTSFAYDANNHLVTTINPDGTQVTHTFDVNGHRTSDTDELNRTTAYSYDIDGHVAQISYPDGSATAATYDATGRRTQLQTPSGVTMSFTFDAAGRPVATANSGTGAVTLTTYDAAGNILSMTDPLGNKTQHTYDADNRSISTTDALGHTTAFSYDAAGNPTSSTDANGRVTTSVFDAANRLIKTIYPDGTSRQSAYDANGKLVSKTDPNGKITRYSYDNIGNLISVTDAQGNTTSYGYDAEGNRISQTDANNHKTVFNYDIRNRRVGRTLPGGQSEAFSYDSAGNLTSHMDFNGKVTAYAYDASNRILSKTPDASFGAATVSYTYLPSGLRSTMTDSSGVTTYLYDSAGRVIQVNKPAGTLSYVYDSLGNLSSLTTGKGTRVNYAYDAINRLSSVSETNTGPTSYAYDNVSNVSSVTYSNGVTHTYAYNSNNQLTSLTARNSAALIAGYTYTLDNIGRRLSAVELNGRAVSYSYDNVYHLTSETISGAASGPNGTVSYAYDAVGNRTQLTSTVTGVTNGSYNYDADDRLTADTYDANGNTISSGGIANVYDFENRLVKQGAVTVTYDGNGNRVAKTAGGITTTYLVDENNVTGFPQVVEESSSDGSSRTLVYGLQRISQRQFVATTNTTLTSFYLYDGHGSVRGLTNAAGTLTDSYDYDGFGNLINTSGSTPNEFLFAGEQFDADLLLYYNRARYLRPTTGRFITMDSFEGDPQSPKTLHKYVYGGGDPINSLDPSGHDDIGDLMGSIEINETLEAISTAVISGPIGSSLVGWVATGLLPAGFIDALSTAAPDAMVVGASASVNIGAASIPLGLTGGGGIEVLAGLGTGQQASYYYFGGGISLGATSVSATLSAYAGAVFNSPTSQDYTGDFRSLSIPLSAITKLRSVVQTNWQLSSMTFGSSLATLPAKFSWALQSALQFAQQPPSSDVAINLFTDPKNYGGLPLRGSYGFSVSLGGPLLGSSSTNISYTWSYYYQLLPLENQVVKFK